MHEPESDHVPDSDIDSPIEENTEAQLTLIDVVREQTSALEAMNEHLASMRKFFVPEEIERQRKRFFDYVKWLTIRSIITVVSSVGAFDLFTWYLQRWETSQSAKMYYTAAREIYEKQNNPEVALELLDHALTLQDRNTEYRYFDAYIQGMQTVRDLLNLDRPLNKTELDAAHKSLAEAIMLVRLEPRRAEAHILESQVQFALGEDVTAAATLNEALRLEPENHFAKVRLATLKVHQEKYDEALDILNGVLKVDPKDKWALLWKAIAEGKRHAEPGVVQACYAQALAVDPNFDLALYNQGWAYLDEKPKNYTEAKRCFESALKVNPAYKEALYGLGMVYGYQDKYELAQTYLSKAVKIDDQFLTAIKWSGIVSGEMHDYDKAIEDFGAALNLNPRDADLYVRRAHMFEKLEKYNEAILDLRMALEIQPDEARTWMYLGSVYAKAGQKKESLEYFDKALALEPAYDEAFAQKADVQAQSGDTPGALASLAQALAVASYKPERYLLQRAALYEESGDFPAALNDLQNALTSDPENATGWLTKAKTLLHLERKDEATAALREALRLKPQFEEAQALLASLAGTAQ